MAGAPSEPRELVIGKTAVPPDARVDLDVQLSEDYSGQPIMLPVSVWRAASPGPIVFVSAAVHGDEINGAGIVREILLNEPFHLSAGTLVLVPVVNVLGFDRQMRYLPDRRDPNRAFPGSMKGSLASRFAGVIFNEIIKKCDYGIDLHTAAVRRTNYPNIRADLNNPGAKFLAESFGGELIIHGSGPTGSLRRTATDAGHPTIILEAGEVWKIEPWVVEAGVRGVHNVLIKLGMVEGSWIKPAYQVLIHKTLWVRSDLGGMLQFHVAPGDVVEKDDAIATNTDLLGRPKGTIRSPVDGVILGMTTLPAVVPGDPVCHIAEPDEGIRNIVKRRRRSMEDSLHGRILGDIATNVTVSEPADSQD